MNSKTFHPGDEAVIATNDDASECKKCAVRLGYWKDEYIGYFVKNTDRRAPEINRGYYARVKGVELCVKKILQVTFFSILLFYPTRLPEVIPFFILFDRSACYCFIYIHLCIIFIKKK